MTGRVEAWLARLDTRVGMTAAERDHLLAGLEAFCARHAIDPDSLVAHWRDYPQLTIRRRPDAVDAPDLAVESFLVHSGVNVFGDIVCVPRTAADLADQGERFVPHGQSRAG